MTDYDPCLSGCDQALAEAELLITSLAEFQSPLDPELGAFIERIATLRQEVERLRGMPTVRVRRKLHPDWINLAGEAALWPTAGRDIARDA